ARLAPAAGGRADRCSRTTACRARHRTFPGYGGGGFLSVLRLGAGGGWGRGTSRGWFLWGCRGGAADADASDLWGRAAPAGVACVIQMHRIERAHGVQAVALEFLIDAAGVREIQHRIAAGAELHALVDRWQEAAAPVGIAAARPLVSRAEHDKAGEVLRLAP